MFACNTSVSANVYVLMMAVVTTKASMLIPYPKTTARLVKWLNHHQSNCRAKITLLQYQHSCCRKQTLKLIHSHGYCGKIPRHHPWWGRNDPLSTALMKMMLMRHLLITISHGLMAEKCLNALNVFLTKSATLSSRYQSPGHGNYQRTTGRRWCPVATCN